MLVHGGSGIAKSSADRTQGGGNCRCSLQENPASFQCKPQESFAQPTELQFKRKANITVIIILMTNSAFLNNWSATLTTISAFQTVFELCSFILCCTDKS